MDLREFYMSLSGTPLAGRTVTYKASSLTEPNGNPVLGTTSTNASGMWEFVGIATGSYDVYVQDGTQVVAYKGLAAIPHAFTDAHIGAAADIQLTKLNGGTLDDTATPDNVAPTLQDRLSDMVSQLKKVTGAANWYTALPTFADAVVANLTNIVTKYAGHTHTGAAGDAATIPALTTHIAAASGVHGLTAGSAVFGNRNTSGEALQRGTIFVTVNIGTRTGSINVTFPVAFTGAAPVVIISESGITGVINATVEGPILVASESASTTGFTVQVIFTANATSTRSIPVSWIAIGTPAS